MDGAHPPSPPSPRSSLAEMVKLLKAENKKKKEVHDEKVVVAAPALSAAWGELEDEEIRSRERVARAIEGCRRVSPQAAPPQAAGRRKCDFRSEDWSALSAEEEAKVATFAKKKAEVEVLAKEALRKKGMRKSKTKSYERQEEESSAARTLAELNAQLTAEQRRRYETTGQLRR